nr:hypothetical protein [Flavobacterium sp.]
LLFFCHFRYFYQVFKAFETSRIRWVFQNFKRLFFCDEAALGFVKSGFLLLKLVFDKPSEWYFCQLFSETQIISPLICFFVFFSANLLSASKLARWVRWRSCCLVTANQSGRQVRLSPTRARA